YSVGGVLLVALALDAVGEEWRDPARVIGREYHQALQRILDQAGLAGAGLTGQGDDSAAAAERLARLSDHPLHLPLAADPLRTRHAAPVVLGNLEWVQRLGDRHRLRYTFELDRRQIAQGDMALDRATGGGRDDHRALFSRRHQPRGEVDVLTHHGILVAAGRAHLAGEDHAGVEADALFEELRVDLDQPADLGVQQVENLVVGLCQRTAKLQRRARGAQWVVLVGGRRAEQRHQL